MPGMLGQAADFARSARNRLARASSVAGSDLKTARTAGSELWNSMSSGGQDIMGALGKASSSLTSNISADRLTAYAGAGIAGAGMTNDALRGDGFNPISNIAMGAGLAMGGRGALHFGNKARVGGLSHAMHNAGLHANRAYNEVRSTLQSGWGKISR